MSVNELFISGFGLGLGLGALALTLTSVYSLTRSGLREI